MVEETLDPAGALGLNDSEFPKSCPRRQFLLGVDVLEMLVDRGDRFLKQLGDLPLRQPERLLVDAQLQSDRSVGRGVEDQAGWVVGRIVVRCHEDAAPQRC